MIERFTTSNVAPAAFCSAAGILLFAALAGCSARNGAGAADLGSPVGPPPPQATTAQPPAPDYGGLFAGALGDKIPADSRGAAFAALTAALDAGQRKSWRGEHGLFGYFEPGAANGSCTAFKATTYLSGRSQTLDARACKSAAGDWRAS